MKGGKVNMSISLFPHNQEAYDSLLETLETERRACIIHPTGTGKSFIGFKYIWLNNLKRRQDHLSDEQITELNDIGMKWRNTPQIRA